MRIEERIRTTVLEKDVRVFWPDQFVGAGLGTRDDVLGALVALVGDGKLEARVQARSSSGHLCWEGTPEAFDTLTAFQCEECEETYDPSSQDPVVYFKVTRGWRGIVDAEKKKREVARAAAH